MEADSAAIDWDGNLLPPRDRSAKSYLTEPDPDFLIARCDELEAALQKIAAPKRPDGTYNLSREACEQIAKEALRHD